jgi:hypothetical protein
LALAAPRTRPYLAGILRVLAATRHLLDMFRRELQDAQPRRQFQRIDKRLLDTVSILQQFA